MKEHSLGADGQAGVKQSNHLRYQAQLAHDRKSRKIQRKLTSMQESIDEHKLNPNSILRNLIKGTTGARYCLENGEIVQKLPEAADPYAPQEPYQYVMSIRKMGTGTEVAEAKEHKTQKQREFAIEAVQALLDSANMSKPPDGMMTRQQL